MKLYACFISAVCHEEIIKWENTNSIRYLELTTEIIYLNFICYTFWIYFGKNILLHIYSICVKNLMVGTFMASNHIDFIYVMAKKSNFLIQ